MTSPATESTNVVAAARDLILVLGTLYLIKTLLLSIDSLWSAAGPISLLASLTVVALCLKRGKERWSSIGLKRPKSIARALLWTSVVFVVTMGLGFVVEAAVSAVTGDASTPSPSVDERYQDRFAHLPGNLPAYLQWLAIAWIVGGFTEELLFRGFLISRFERLFARTSFAVVLAVLLQAVLFGHQHFYYQGLTGALATGLIALVSGAFYVLLKRNIWPLILSHGLANTLGFTLIYLSVIPPP